MNAARRSPPQGAPPPYVFVNRVYGRSLRPVVISIAALAALWTLLWAISSFKELNVDNSDHMPKLATFALVQGILLTIACAIELFGIFSAATQKVALVRIYAFLSALGALIVIAVGLMRTIIHFVFKSDLMTECQQAVHGDVIDFRFGIWGSSGNIGDETPEQFCSDAYSHDSWAEVVSLIIEIVLGLIFTAISFAYLRQLLDPSSPANASRAPSNQMRMDNYPTNYNADYVPSYAPPPGPPPQFDAEAGKPPGYSYGEGEYDDLKGDKDVKEDPFSDFDGPSVPRPLHFAEERDVTGR